VSEILNIVGASVQDRAPSTADAVFNVTTGLPFTAEIDPAPDPFLIPESLGNDPRAKLFLYVNYQTALTLSKHDIVTFRLFGNKCQFELIDGFSNPALPLSRFVVSKMTPKDQQ